MAKILVAYFSASGVTARAAKALAAAADADLFEIKPAVPYTAADLNWQDKNARSTVEMKDPSSRPAIAEGCENIGDYDAIFVGFPIWWYVAPTIIQTFLESADLAGKTMIAFATSGGSGLGETVKRLQASASPDAIWKEGKLLNGASESTLKQWLADLGL